MSLISVAPMMDWTDRHDRYFLRLIAPNILLYTEMITAQALKHGDVDKLLSFHPSEHPIALQLGGSDPLLLSYAAKLGESFGFDEINLNVGCPSPRVSSGRFGACLMFEPTLVSECIHAMTESVTIPVTVKCRLGVDHHDTDELLHQFIDLVSKAKSNTFIIHARKAWLKGLSPKQNREVPPLQYDRVYKMKNEFPHLKIILNGGVHQVSDIESHLSHVDGVMIGRKAYHQPYFLAEIQIRFWPEQPTLSRHDVVNKLCDYIENELRCGTKLNCITRHILGLFHGEAGSAKWKRYLSEEAHKKNASVDVVIKALSFA